MRKNNEHYFVVVVEDETNRKIVGMGTLFLERKFIRDCGIAGHIEDIVVLKEYRGNDVGKVYNTISFDIHSKISGLLKH